MEALIHMNKSLDYIERHLDDEITMEKAAAIACMSKFHFQRMFLMVTGVTPGDYVRKRRLTIAAQELANSNVKIIDVALKYGYETPESFSKAFKKAHGMSPSEVRKAECVLKAYPRISFQIQLKGAKAMNYRFIEKEAFPVVGKAIKLSTAKSAQQGEISKFWQEANQTNGLNEQLEPLTGSMGFLGICMDFNQEQETMSYMIAAEKPEGFRNSGLEERIIPPRKWTVFESNGPMPHAIQEVWGRIFGEWFPSTGYELAEGPELEVYPAGDPYSDDYRCEVWIPIIKK
ncbi:AraC family transcriptional regulator [Metabacillus sp. 84]|uniref:AraC family transcriptional regulator n=1 Tax=unclassified Metabacillus TaxID=2675274 RepID=UPI003CF631AA